jgi:acyl carrier protein
MVARRLDPSGGLLQASRGRHMQGFDIDIRHRVTTLVKTILEQNAVSAELAPEARLVDAGLTSMDMVSLMLAVEAEFDFTIPQDQITPDNFQSIAALERMIAGQLRIEQAA